MAYRIVSIEGTGENWQGTKLADDLVRRSRIFWSMSKKILYAKSLAGTQRYHRLKTAEKLKQAEKDFKTATRDFQRHIKEVERKAKMDEVRLEKKVLRHKQTIKNTQKRVNASKWQREKDKRSYLGNMYKKNVRSGKLAIKANIYSKYQNFFTRPVPKGGFWDSNEFWLRYIVTVEEMKMKNGLLNADYYVLLTSLYFDHITTGIIVNRTQWSVSTVRSAINRLVEKEYLYKDGTTRYIPTHKGINEAKKISINAKNKSMRSYFTEDIKPRQIVEK